MHTHTHTHTLQPVPVCVPSILDMTTLSSLQGSMSLAVEKSSPFLMAETEGRRKLDSTSMKETSSSEPGGVYIDGLLVDR